MLINGVYYWLQHDTLTGVSNFVVDDIKIHNNKKKASFFGKLNVQTFHGVDFNYEGEKNTYHINE